MNRLVVVCMVASVVGGVMSANGAADVSYAANATVAEPLVLTGEYVVEVASGVTVEYSGEISGTGPLRKTGAGTLVLSCATGNTFTEGVQISQGIVRADTAGSLGDGEIFLDGTVKDGSYGVVRQIFFNVPSATFANNIRIAGKDANSGHGPTAALIRASGDTTLSGTFDFSGLSNGGNCCASIVCGSTTDSESNLVISNGIQWSGKYLHLNAFGNITIGGSVLLGTLAVDHNDDLTGTITLMSPETSIGTIRLCGANLETTVANAFGDAAVILRKGYSSAVRSAIDLGGKDQSLASLEYTGASQTAFIKTTGRATLTLKGGTASKTSYQTLSGNMSLVVDAANYPSFTQTFAKQAHTMSGVLCVSNGTLAATLGAKFANVGEVHVGPNGTLTAGGSSAFTGLFAGATNVVVDGSMAFDGNVLNPFTDGAVDLSLGEDAVLTLSGNPVLRVKTLKVNGEKVKNNTTWGVGGTALAQLSGGTIIVNDGSATISEAAWTGAAADNGIAQAANWDTSPELPALDDATTIATFAAGGATATVDRVVSLRGVRLSAQDGFTFANGGGSARIELGADGLGTDEATQSHEPVYTFEVPLKASEAQEWSVASGAVVRASAGVLDMSGGRITKTGDGELSISGETTLAGSLVHQKGTLRLSGTIGAPEGESQGTAAKLGPKTITVPGDIEGLTTVLDGVTFEKPVWMAGRGSVDDPTVNWLQFGAASTNVFKCPSVFHTNVGYLNLDSNSALVFDDSVSFNSTVNFCNGTIIVRGGKMTATTGNGFYLRSGSIRLETSGNQITLRGRKVRKVELMVDYALTNRWFETDTDYPQIYMNGTVQHCTTLRTTSGARFIAGDGPAKFIIGPGGKETAYHYGTATGCFTFEHGGDQDFWIYRDNDESTGDLIVSKSMMVLGTDASWRGGTNVVVRGTGTFRMTASGQLNRKIVCVSISDSGVVDLQNGAKQTVKELRIDGNSLPSGTYGGADAPEGVDKTYATHFSGNGTMHVSGAFMLIVR